MKIAAHFMRTFLIVASVLLLIEVRDLINPPRPMGVEITPDFIILPEDYIGPDDIRHPDNSAYVVEVAFNLGIEPHEVTQAQFNRRYK